MTSTPRHPRFRARGFTLVELIISLAAALVITLGVAGLSREVSNTFNEEIRVAGAQASLRTAIDRLRSDLQRASFQSTGNFASDNIFACAAAYPNVPTQFAPIRRLAGIRLFDGAQSPITMPDKSIPAALPLSATNNLAPDAIDIAGNMTGADWFEARTEPQSVAGTPAGCKRIYVKEQTLPIYRLQQASTAATQAAWWRNLFQPTDPGTTTTPGTDATAQFIVRYQDSHFQSWYFASCKTASAAGMNLAAPSGQQYWVDIDVRNGFPAAAAGSCGATGQTANPEGAFVNPVHIVRWQLEQDVAATDGLNPEKSTTKYDLTRTYIDAVTGNELTTTKEHVAEYAIDLKFAVAYDNEVGANPNPPSPQVLSTQLDDGKSIAVAPDVTTLVANNGTGPQRIRSVMVRLATREANADRTAALAVANPAQYTTGAGPAQTYLYRYALGNTSAQYNYARARTVVTEVALPNQQNLYY